ncbi:MAG: hypothetical protein QNL05_13225 [Gammaproteobacteria bacterium]|nr:hypothetical protein [Gammaproteobacteria bacterium]MDX2488473.1 hypothetical protein [Gammaproteobacteria bacterium]
MLENVSRSHDVFHKAKLDFIKLSHKTEDTLKKEKTKLTRQLKRANTRVAIEKDRLITAEKRLAQKRTAAKKKQVKKIKAMIEKEQKMAMKLRKAIDPLSEKLSQAKNHAITARFFDKGMEKIDKEIESYLKKESAKSAKKLKKKSVQKRSVKSKTVKK